MHFDNMHLRNYNSSSSCNWELCSTMSQQLSFALTVNHMWQLLKLWG